MEHIIIGDLHSNPAMLMLSLYKHGVIEDTPDNQKKLKDLIDVYTTILNHKPAQKEELQAPEELGKEKYELCGQDPDYIRQLHTYTHITESIPFSESKKVHIHLLGDHLGDRGANDYLILHALVRLVEQNIKLTILHSNHTHAFFDPYVRQITNPECRKGKKPYFEIDLEEDEKRYQKQSLYYFAYTYPMLTEEQKATALRGIQINIEKTKLIELLPFTKTRHVILTHAAQTLSKELDGNDYQGDIERHNSELTRYLNNKCLNLEEERPEYSEEYTDFLWDFVWSRIKDADIPIELDQRFRFIHGHDDKTNISGLSLNGQFGKYNDDFIEPLKETHLIGSIAFSDQGYPLKPVIGLDCDTVRKKTLSDIIERLIPPLEKRYPSQQHRLFCLGERQRTLGRDKIRRLKEIHEKQDQSTPDPTGMLKRVQWVASIHTGCIVRYTKTELLLMQECKKRGMELIPLSGDEKKELQEECDAEITAGFDDEEIEMMDLGKLPLLR